MDYPTRKPNRLVGYDYSSTGAYFITVCTKDRKKIFWESEGATIGRPNEIVLSKYGLIVEEAILNISKHYPAVTVDKYIVMPDHIHLLLQIHNDNDGRPMVAPTISNVVKQMKGYVSKQIGFPVWQKLFDDHVIRNQNDYNEIWQYIDNNPSKLIYNTKKHPRN